jgi:hypothetical protein
MMILVAARTLQAELEYSSFGFESAIKRIAPPSSVYAKRTQVNEDWPPEANLEELAAIVRAMHADLQAGGLNHSSS